MSYMHYVKLTRDAAPMMDNFVHRMTDEGHALALRRTEFTYDQMNIFVRPQPQDRDVVFGVLVEEFSKAGWGYGSETAKAEDDPNRPVVSMTFRHPATHTRLGAAPPIRPGLLRFEVPMPDPRVPITTDLIEYYANRAADITRGLMAQQVVDEEGKMPGTPGQGGLTFRPPAWEPTTVSTIPRPLNEVFAPDTAEESEDE